MDLQTDLSISLKEALTGFKREICLLNSDEPVTIDCESVVNPYDTKRIPEYGLRGRGDLILRFKIQFPIILEESSKELIKTIPT